MPKSATIGSNGSTGQPTFKPLLPASSKEQSRPLPDSTDNGNDNIDSRRRRPHMVTVACEACRKRKTKCSGERPRCAACIKRSVPCGYAATLMESHSQAWKRRYEVLMQQQREASAQQELFDSMRTMTTSGAIDIVARIQSGKSAREILDQISGGNLLLQLRMIPETKLRYELPYRSEIPKYLLQSGSLYLDCLIYEAGWKSRSYQPEALVVEEGLSKYLKPFHAAKLVEPRLQRAKPSEWTAVSKNDILMRELLASYFSREYYLFPVFQKDYFLEDMANGATACCSSLLTNVVLAYSCYCSNKFPHQYAYWYPHGLSYLFLAEAKRLWELESAMHESPSLTSIQAIALINILYNVCGLDKIGNVYGLQAISAAQRLGIFNGNFHMQSKRIRDATNFTAWGLYNLESLMSIHYLREPNLCLAPLVEPPDPLVEPEWYGEIWTRYPLDQSLTPSYFGTFFKLVCRFSVILNDICQKLFAPSSKISADQARILGGRLFAWYSALPQILDAKHIVLPAHFFLHYEYHNTVMMLYQSFKNYQWSDSFPSEAAIRDAEQSLQILPRIYLIRHSFQEPDIYMISYLSRLGALSLTGLEQHPIRQELEDIRSTLALVMVGIAAQCNHYMVPRIIYNTIKNAIPFPEAQLLGKSGFLDEVADYPDAREEWLKAADLISWPMSKLLQRFVTLN